MMDDQDKSTGGVLEAWAYEASRLFRDKLVSQGDQSRFDDILKSALRSEWNSNAMEEAGQSLYVTAADTSSAPGAPLPKFGRKLGSLGRADWERLVDKGTLAFARESDSGRDLDLVMVDELLETVARVDRALTRPGGSVLLAGRAGIGRRSAVSVAAAMQRAKLVSLKMTRNYGLKQFKAELKAAMQLSGVDGEQVFLLLEDHNLVDPHFLDMVNSVLSSGEVPGLYTPEEMEPLLTPLRDRAADEGVSGSGDLLAYFARCVRRNLHVVLVMDCTSKEFVVNCESNPALYKECQVIWREHWSERSLLNLPLLLLTRQETVEGEDIGKKSAKGVKDKQQKKIEGGDELLSNFKRVHSSVTEAPADELGGQLSPLKYITFIKTYQAVYSKEKKEILSR